MGARPAIQVQGLGKVFPAPRSVRDLVMDPLHAPQPITALAGVTLDIQPGEVFGLLGPNGAGKTTFLKLLTCLVLPTTGSARVNGHSIPGDELAVKRSIGYVTSDERSFYWRLTGRENLRFFGRLQGLKGESLRARCTDLLDRVELDAEDADEPFMNYSSGMRQKLAIARGLLHDPPLLFMDEPTRSLDPLTARHLRKLVSEILVAKEGKTILLATHNLHEADALCSRIGILVHGRLMRVGTPAELRRWVDGGEVYRLEVEGMERGGIPPQARILEEGSAVRFEVGLDEGGLDSLLRRIHGAGGRIRACEKVEATLESVFDRICGDAETVPEPRPDVEAEI